MEDQFDLDGVDCFGFGFSKMEKSFWHLFVFVSLSNDEFATENALEVIRFFVHNHSVLVHQLILLAHFLVNLCRQ